MQRPSKRRNVGDSGRGDIEEPAYFDVMDLEDSVEGSCGLSERDSDVAEPEHDAWDKGRETKTTPLLPEDGCSAVVYDKLHGLSSDADWWLSYFG